MKTKLCRSRLVEISKDIPQIGDIYINSIGLFIWSKEHARYDVKNTLPEFKNIKVYELILISLDPNEKIEVGDKYYDSHNDLVLVATAQSDHNVYQYKKVIATQSQLSEEYIQRFVEEYNSGNVKDVEVEYYKNDYFGSKCEQYSPKLTNGFVTIVEKELIHFPYKIEKDKIILYGAGKFQEESLTLDRSKIAILFVELYKFLHFDKDPILYTEEEVEILCLKAMRDVLKHGHSLDTSNWFNQNKKQ